MLGTVPAGPAGDTTNLGTAVAGAVRTDGGVTPMHGVVPPTEAGAVRTDGGRPMDLTIPGVRPLVSTTLGDGTTLGVGDLPMDGTVTTEILGTTVGLTTTVVPLAAVAPLVAVAPTTVEDLPLIPDARPPVWWLAAMHLCGLP